VILSFPIALLMATAAPSHGADDAVLLTTQEWPPYQSQASGAPAGIAVDAVRCIFDRLGMSVEIVFLPWQRAQEDVRNGNAAGFFAASRSAERDQFATLSTPIAPQVWTWFYRRGSAIAPDDAGFKAAARVTGTFGSNMAAWLRESGFRVQDEPRTTDQLLQMLERGYVDAVLANSVAFELALEAAGRPADTFLSRPERDQPLGVYFANRFLDAHPGFLARFDAAVPPCVPSR
jgi:polar amino acid transport system substrate-binding protein